MIIELPLAGHSAPWHMPESRLLRDWLQRQPWATEGGTLVLHTGGERSLQRLRIALREAVFAADYGAGLVRYLEANVEVNDSLLNALTLAVGLTPASLEGDTFRALATHLLHMRGLVVALTPKRGRLNLARDASELVDRMRKHTDCLPLTLLILGTPDRPTGALDNLDFTSGLPDLQGLRSPTNDSQLKSAYLHVRLAWESGGELERALAWSEHPELLACSSETDDAGLEQTLNSLAGEALDAAGDVVPLLSWLLNHCSPSVANSRMSSIPRDLRHLLREHRSGPCLRTPCLARGLLHRHRSSLSPAMTTWLRAHLVCRTLASHVLARCFDLEMQLRGKAASYLTNLPLTFASPRARENLTSARSGNNAIESIPAGHPAAFDEDTCVWEFSTLGEVIAVLARSQNFDQLCTIGDQLRRLRNVLAHGHYACWPHLDAIRSMEQSVARW